MRYAQHVGHWRAHAFLARFIKVLIDPMREHMQNIKEAGGPLVAPWQVPSLGGTARAAATGPRSALRTEYGLLVAAHLSPASALS